MELRWSPPKRTPNIGKGGKYTTLECRYTSKKQLKLVARSIKYQDDLYASTTERIKRQSLNMSPILSIIVLFLFFVHKDLKTITIHAHFHFIKPNRLLKLKIHIICILRIILDKSKGFITTSL